jgi:hypothetical protein
MKRLHLLGTLFASVVLTQTTATWAELNFEFSQIIDTGLQGSTVDSGDLDGDGDIDLAVANIFSHSITISLNDGDGNFTQTLNIPLKNGLMHPVALSVGDIDGDGLDDIAIGQIQQFGNALTIPFDDPSLVVWFNDGNANFTQISTKNNLFGIPSSVVIADYDNDGVNDVIMGNLGTLSFEGLNIISIDAGIDLFKNTGNRTFAAAKKIERDGSFVDEIVFDFNNDGFTDIFGVNQGYADYNENFEVILNNVGIATFIGSSAGLIPLLEFETPYAPHDLDHADYDQDGDEDIFVSLVGEFGIVSYLGREASIEVYENAGPIFVPKFSIPIPGIGFSINTSDFDLDGDIDIIVTVQEIVQQAAGNLLVPSVRFIENIDGVFTEVGSLGLQEKPDYSCKDDFDGDGDIDIAVLCSISDSASADNSFPGQVYVFKNNALTKTTINAWELY